MSQITIAFHGISPPLAEVPSLILRTALSVIPCVSERRGVDGPNLREFCCPRVTVPSLIETIGDL